MDLYRETTVYLTVAGIRVLLTSVLGVMTATCHNSKLCKYPNKRTPNHPGATGKQSTCSVPGVSQV